MFLFLFLIVLSLDTEFKSAIDKSIEKVVNYFFEAQVLLKETIVNTKYKRKEPHVVS